MNILGKYKVNKITVQTDDGFKFVPFDEFIENSPEEEREEYERLQLTVYVIDESCCMLYYPDTSEDMIAMAKEEGFEYDDFGVILEKHKVKEENGEFYIENGMEDNEIHYSKITPDEDGDLIFDFVTLKKID